MKIFLKCLAAVFGLLALAAAVFGIHVAIDNRDALPVLVEPSQDALNVAANLLQAVADGDYEKAGTMILGDPDLGVNREADGDVGKYLWNAYQESLEYKPVGDAFTTADGIAVRYSVRYLDVNSVAANLRTYSQTLLEKRVEEADELSDVYDENNEYREDVVMAVLYDAAELALKENAAYVEKEFNVNLVYRGGKWWALLDDGLLAAITGGLAG